LRKNVVWITMPAKENQLKLLHNQALKGHDFSCAAGKQENHGYYGLRRNSIGR
jgi:hypothetical protein